MATHFGSGNTSILNYSTTTTLPYTYNGTLYSTTRSPAHGGGEFVGKEWKIITRFIYIIIFIFGTVGNLLTCYIIISRKFMRRVIHIYTFNLAVSDLAVILLYIPVEMVRNENDLRWTMGASMCKISYIVTPTSLISSVCTLVAITLDRHRGVTRPFKWRGDSKKLLRYSIPAIWIIAIACSSPLFYYANIIQGNNGYYCIEMWTKEVHATVYWISMFFVMVVVPLLIIILANVHMIYVMQKLSNSIDHTGIEQHRQHRRMIRMVVSLVLVYALCSSPQHIVFFWFQYGNLESKKNLSVHLFKAANIMIIVQSAINPIIYGTGRKDFKGAFKNIFQCLKMREWISASREETKLGGVESLVTSSRKPELPESTCEEHHTQLVVNKKLEKLRRKSEQRCITDTPPFRRSSLGVTGPLEPLNKINENGTLLGRENMSLPIGCIIGKKVTFKNLKGEEDDENQNLFTLSAEIRLDRSFLRQISNLAESEV